MFGGLQNVQSSMLVILFVRGFITMEGIRTTGIATSEPLGHCAWSSLFLLGGLLSQDMVSWQVLGPRLRRWRAEGLTGCGDCCTDTLPGQAVLPALHAGVK